MHFCNASHVASLKCAHNNKYFKLLQLATLSVVEIYAAARLVLSAYSRRVFIKKIKLAFTPFYIKAMLKTRIPKRKMNEREREKTNTEVCGLFDVRVQRIAH